MCAANTTPVATADNAVSESARKLNPAESSHPPDQYQHTCDICMEDLPAAAMHTIGSCMHRFCKGCLERHIQTQMTCRALPVICPAVKCSSGIDADECSVLLHNKDDIALLTQVI